MMLVVCFILFAALFFIEKGYIWIARKKKIEDSPEVRSSHTIVTVRGGGIVFVIAMLAYFIYAGFPYPYFFIGLTVLSIISFIDDIHSLSPKTRLVCQMIAMSLIALQISSSSFGIMLLIIFLSTGVVNVVNFMDGINGMLCGVSFVSLAFLLLIDYEIIKFMDPLIIWSIFIANLVFCCFNFKKSADCFAGDIGSMSMGYILFFLVLKLIWTSNNIGWAVLLAPFLIDGFLTIAHRILLRENILLPHRKHAYEIMANELHIPHLVVSGIYMLIQTICALIFIWQPTITVFIVEMCVLSLMYLLFKAKYYPLHVESINSSLNQSFDGTVLIVGSKEQLKQFRLSNQYRDISNPIVVSIDAWDDNMIGKYNPQSIYVLDSNLLSSDTISDMLIKCKEGRVKSLNVVFKC